MTDEPPAAAAIAVAVAPTAPAASFLARCKDPAIVLAVITGLLTAGAWGASYVSGQTQLIQRVSSLEDRANKQDQSLAQFQAQVGGRLEAMDARLGQSSLQLAALQPELKGIRELLTNMDQRNHEVDERIVQGMRAMDQRWQQQLQLVLGQTGRGGR